MINQKQFTKGLQGEKAAEDFLLASGMRCLERRYRREGGEIDLIMQDGETVVFVEVKSRPSGRSGDGLIAVTPAKRKRIIKAATVYLMEREDFTLPVRFDVVEITADGVKHVANAFQANGW